MSAILTRPYVEELVHDLVNAAHDEWRRHATPLLAHDAALRAENERLRNACKATLMFYRSGYWDEEAADEWRHLTGSQDATTRVLCDTVRRALAAPQEEKEVPNG